MTMDSNPLINDLPTMSHDEIHKLTQARLLISPYLPPPLLNAMKSIDTNPNIQSVFGQTEEPSMIILSSILMIVLIGYSVKFLSFLISGNAVEGLHDDEDSPEGRVLSDLYSGDDKNNKGKNRGLYNETVVIFGSSYSGKTCLFHTLLSSKRHTKEKSGIPKTVMSLKANVSMLTNDDQRDDEKMIRLVDYPGHITLSAHLPSLLFPSASSKSGDTIRSLLVVDSTKSVSEAAMLLYNVLTNGSIFNKYHNSNIMFHIMVVCNKSDATGAKNWRRCKIQLRSELDKLKKISSSVSTSSAAMIDAKGDEERHNLIGKTIDLDDLSKNGLPFVKISFLSFSSISGDGLEALTAFVKSGDLLMDNSSILSNKRK